MKKSILLIASVLSATFFATSASAIPSFSRQTGMDCQACHTQHVPILNGFGQAFKASGYPMMGSQGKVEGDRLSIPNTLNASMLIKARYQQSNGPDSPIPGTNTNGGQWQVPEEFSLFFGGRIAENVGFFFEGNTATSTLLSGFKLPAAFNTAGLTWSVIPYLTDTLGASYGFEQSSTGAVRNVRWAEHRKEISAQQYIGTDTAATGVAFVAQNDIGYINFSRWAPALMARPGAAQVLSSSYLRIAATPTVVVPTMGDWAMHIGAQFWGGSNYAPVPLSTGVLATVDTRAFAIDFQGFGKLGGKEMGVYATWARSPGGAAAQPNILNVGSTTAGVADPTQYRVNDRKAWTIGFDYSVIPHTLHLGAAYRRAYTGGAANIPATPAGPAVLPIVGVNPSDNAFTLTGVYNFAQNIELHLNQSFYSGSLYDAAQPYGNQLTTLMLEAAW